MFPFLYLRARFNKQDERGSGEVFGRVDLDCRPMVRRSLQVPEVAFDTFGAWCCWPSE